MYDIIGKKIQYINIDNDEGDDLENNNQRMTILKTNEQDLR